MPTPLALTPGEPAGIGPDLAVIMAQQPQMRPVVAFADPELLANRAAELGLPLRVRDLGGEMPDEPAEPGEPGGVGARAAPHRAARFRCPRRAAGW